MPSFHRTFMSSARAAALGVAGLLSVATARLEAQTVSGSVEGRVVDSTGRALVGTNVMDSRTRTGAVTNAQGYYEIKAVPVGVHTLVVRYIGFSADSFTVTVVQGPLYAKPITLRPNVAALAAMVVNEKVAGEAYAINAKRNADNIIDVETSDVIKSRPDPNIADAVGRLPGVSIERDEGEGKYIQ